MLAVPDDFTLRAVVGGLAVGSLLCASNLYFGLQSAWITMASLQSALVGYGLVRALPNVLNFAGVPFTPQENAVLQATAVSLGSMPLTAGLIGIVPAFNLLRPEKDGANVGAFSFGWVGLLLWCASMAFFGIFFASPMRSPMIIREKLRFPSGSATAQLIAVLHGTTVRKEGKQLDSSTQPEGLDEEERRPLLSNPTDAPRLDSDRTDAERGMPALVYSFAASAATTIAAFFLPVIYAVPIFDPLLPRRDAAARWGWWFTPSLSYIGQGIIMGPQTTTSMFLGALVGWAILSPLAHHMGWTNGVPMDAEEGSRAWILWPCLAIMTSESIVGLLTLLAQQHSAKQSPSSDAEESEEDEPPERLTPTSWAVGGLVLATGASVGILAILFGEQHVQFWVPLVGVVLAGILSILAVRALGATDLNPVNALGKLSQLAFAFLQPGGILANMIGGALSEAGAMQAGELMQDYKTGHLVHASPRGQFLGQMAGSAAGVVVSTVTYKLYERSYRLPGPEMPAPAARLWLNFARLVNNGALPRRSAEAMAVSAILFGLSTLAKGTAQSRIEARKRLRPGAQGAYSKVQLWESIALGFPNGIAFAVGLGLNTPNYSLARLIGGVVSWYAQRKSRASPSGLPPVGLLVLSAGFVLGEGFASIATLLLKEAGLGPISCAGCRGGCGGGC